MFTISIWIRGDQIAYSFCVPTSILNIAKPHQRMCRFVKSLEIFL